MKINRQLNQFRRMHGLIQRKATGNSKTFARKLNTSVATVYRYLEELRNLGAPIEYCRSRQTYYYGAEGFELKI